MSRIVVYSMAHRGDVFPYVPIANELARRGHDVTYVVPREFHPLFAGEQFRCVHSGTDFSPIELDKHGDFLRRWGMRMGGGMVLRLYFGVFTIPHLDALFEAIDAELEGADLLVSHPAAAVVGAMSCERRGLPWVVGDLFPMLLPTAAMPPSGIPNLGPRVNRALWKGAKTPALDRVTSGRDFKRFRTGLGLSNDGWNILDARLSPHRTFGLASPHYMPAQPEWPEGYDLLGFTTWEGPGGGAIPPDVQAFLDAGEAPVIVTLGSSGASARPEIFEAVASQLDERNVRGLFLTSNDQITARVRKGTGDRHGVWPFVPLAALLPHARGIVHSGAHGTNALTLEAGVPAVVVPCLFDQLWHGQRLEQLGVGVLARKRRSLDAAIDRLLDDASLADAARELAAKVNTDDGITHACDAIEAVLARG